MRAGGSAQNGGRHEGSCGIALRREVACYRFGRSFIPAARKLREADGFSALSDRRRRHQQCEMRTVYAILIDRATDSLARPGMDGGIQLRRFRCLRTGRRQLEISIWSCRIDLGKFTLGLYGQVRQNRTKPHYDRLRCREKSQIFMSKGPMRLHGRNLRLRRDILPGTLGLIFGLGMLIRGCEPKQKCQEQSTGFIYALEFVTTHDGNIKPAFQSIPIRM